MVTGKESTLTLIRRFLGDMLVHRRRLAVVIASIIGASLTTLAGPYILEVAIDKYIFGGKYEELPFIAGVYLMVLVAQWVFTTSRDWYINVFGQDILYDLRRSLMEKSLRARAEFYEDMRTGDQVSRIINDTSYVNDVLVSGLLGGIGDLGNLLGIITAMILLDPILTLITLANLPLMVAVAWYFGRKMRKVYRATREKIARVSSIVEETVSGVETVRAYGRENLAEKEFRNASLETYRAYMRATIYIGVFWPLMNISSMLSIVTVIAAGAYLIYVGATSIGVVVAFIQYVQRFRGPINNLISMYDSLQSALASLERIYEVMDTPEEKDDGIEIDKLKGRIEYRDVWFEYTPGNPVIRGVNLTIESGEAIALVGHTGAGKTTLINLLLRFRDPTNGEILIDGVDTRRISRRSLRRRIGYVLQETYLFPGTILENIQIAKPGVTRDEVIQTCKKLGIHDFIERLPNGYDTDAGEAGKKLSTGEKQLISIARAMLREPEIIVLDEALSSIDPKTEEIVRRAMHRLLQGRTSIIIAHRLAVTQTVDRIVVLENGQVVEEGTFKELMVKKGRFYKLYKAQEEGVLASIKN